MSIKTEGYTLSGAFPIDKTDRYDEIVDATRFRPPVDKQEQSLRGPTRATTLPTDPKRRKQFPIGTGVLDYFPDAIVAVAEVSYVGNEQHNPGQPLHWNRAKSTDEADTIMRHYLQRGEKDSDGLRHSAKMAWRALAFLQKEIETEQEELNRLDQGMKHAAITHIPF